MAHLGFSFSPEHDAAMRKQHHQKLANSRMNSICVNPVTSNDASMVNDSSPTHCNLNFPSDVSHAMVNVKEEVSNRDDSLSPVVNQHLIVPPTRCAMAALSASMHESYDPAMSMDFSEKKNIYRIYDSKGRELYDLNDSEYSWS